MEKITRQMLADEAADRWRQQYFGEQWYDDRKAKIYQALKALPKGAAPDDIDAVIGNGSWTNLDCDECGASGVDFVVQVGQEPDYESRTASLCGACIDLLKQKF